MPKLERTADLVAALNTQATTLRVLLASLQYGRATTRDCEIYAEQLSGDNLPRPSKRGGFDLNGERHALVAALRKDYGAEATRERAEYLLHATELVLADNLDAFADLKPFAPGVTLPVPKPTRTPAPLVEQPSREAQAEQAFSTAALDVGLAGLPPAEPVVSLDGDTVSMPQTNPPSPQTYPTIVGTAGQHGYTAAA
jgi:hypothetical protein